MSESFYVRYKLPWMLREKWKCLSVTTAEAANREADKLRIELEWERSGIIPPKALRDAQQKLLSDHLDDYLRDKAAKRNDAKYISNCRAHLLHIFQDCGWKAIGDATSDDFISWRADHLELRGKTLNDYLGDLKTFFEWLKRLNRAVANPFEIVERVDARREDEGKPRALCNAELENLCTVTTGERRCLYRFAARSGLRRNELEELRWCDMYLDVEVPQVEVRASTAKNAKREFVDLLDGSAEMMRAYRPLNARQTDRVFPSGVPHIRVVKKDFESAGISLLDERKRPAVFHSLRHTFGTWLALNDFPLQVTQRLMRHSDPNITMRVYIDAKLLKSVNGEA